MKSEINKRAWHIRRITAKRLGCPLMDVMWGECLRMAKNAIDREEINRKSLVIEQTWKGVSQTKGKWNYNAVMGILVVLNMIVWYAIVTM